MATTSEINVLRKIEGEPYFTLRLLPSSEPEAPIDAGAMKKLVYETKVSLRGWDFPHVDPRIVHKDKDHIFSVIDWNRHIELWRLYGSGQFTYIGNLWDVYGDFQERLRAELDQNIFEANASQKASVKGLTSFIGLIYSVTEFYVFAARLASVLDWSGTVNFKNVLHNVEGWILACGDPSILWHSFYQCHTTDIDLSRIVSVSDLLADPSSEAVPAIKTLFAGFDWDDASVQMIRQWQTKLMSGKFAF